MSPCRRNLPSTRESHNSVLKVSTTQVPKPGKLRKLLAAPVTYRLWRPNHLALIVSNVLGPGRQSAAALPDHLAGAIDWLCRAQDERNAETDAGGVSAGWSFEDGWLPSYPETSGYIVETFLAAEKVLDRPDLAGRANRILDWELSIQLPDGSFPGHFGEVGSQPVIFNTGQIMHGLLAGYEQLGRADCLEAATRAGHWMVKCQDDDGCWRRNVHNGVPHVYNTRAAWALLRTGIATGDQRFLKAATINIEWALTQQRECGWFARNAFTDSVAPYTHTIAYAIRGILESGLLLQDERFVIKASAAARALAQRQRADGWLAGVFDEGWIAKATYCCLTGLAQTVLIWQRLIHTGGYDNLRSHVQSGIEYLCRNHCLIRDSSPRDGGIAGSMPIWGAYSRFEYPNWATKFFADTLLHEIAPVIVPQPTAVPKSS